MSHLKIKLEQQGRSLSLVEKGLLKIRLEQDFIELSLFSQKTEKVGWKDSSFQSLELLWQNC